MENGKAIVCIVQDLFVAVRLKDTLRAQGYRSLTLPDERDLRTTLAAERPHLVILDLHADGVDPLSVVSAARESVPGRPIPVLAFGPHADVKKRDEALKAGVQRVVPKSLLAAELPQLVQAMLRS